MNKHNERFEQTSARKIAANQENAQKSTGPHNSNLTRYNAAKHGLLAEGVTEIDNPSAFLELCSRLQTQFDPVGEVEGALVRRVALCLVRLRRAALTEAELITEKLNPPLTKTTYPDEGDMTELVEKYGGKTVVLDPGLPARLSVADVEALQKLQRYETAIENKFYRALNQLERLQRMRRGDKIPAPASLDIGIHGGCDELGSFGNLPLT